MDFLFDPLKEIIIDMIGGMLKSITEKLNISSTDLPMTPSAWNPEVYNFIEIVSNDIVLPIAGIMLTFIVCYEFLTMIMDKNNMQDFFIQDIVKWLFKTVIAVILLSNMFTFIEAVFELSSELVTKVALLENSSEIPNLSDTVANLTDSLADQNIAELTLLLLQTGIMWLGVFVVNFFILPMIIAARMFNIYLLMTLSPIPFATFANREWGSIGQNYVKSLIAIGLQAVLMQVCFMVYQILISTGFTGDGETGNPISDITLYFIYGVLLVLMLWKTGAISKSILNVH